MTTTTLPLAEIWPEGVTDLRCDVVVDASDFRYADFKSVLDEKQLWQGETPRTLSIPFRGRSDSLELRGVVEVEVPSAEPAILLTWKYWLVSPGAVEPPRHVTILPLGTEFQIVSQHLKPHDHTVLATATFRGSRKQWQPSVALPVQLPGILEGVEGSPNLTGLDFSFGPGAVVREAKIRIIPENEVEAELSVIVDFNPVATLAHRSMERLREHLPLVVSKGAPKQLDLHLEGERA
jgi:hypothetical protein